MPVLEICVDSLASAIAAEEGGAQRIELCSALSEGGITPSLGLIRAVRSRVGVTVYILIRPRCGNFVYSLEEIAIMREDISLAAQAGADGIVLGLLTPAGTVDVEGTRALVEFARPMEVTFHRAFDLTPDPLEALEAVIQTGADRLLTSGAQSSALLGQTCILGLVQASRGRISIMVGGSVRAENVREIAHSTGADEWHAALRQPSLNPCGHSKVKRGLAQQLGSDLPAYTVKVADVKALSSALESSATH